MPLKSLSKQLLKLCEDKLAEDSMADELGHPKVNLGRFIYDKMIPANTRSGNQKVMAEKKLTDFIAAVCAL